MYAIDSTGLLSCIRGMTTIFIKDIFSINVLMMVVESALHELTDVIVALIYTEERNIIFPIQRQVTVLLNGCSSFRIHL